VGLIDTYWTFILLSFIGFHKIKSEFSWTGPLIPLIEDVIPILTQITFIIGCFGVKQPFAFYTSRMAPFFL